MKVRRPLVALLLGLILMGGCSSPPAAAPASAPRAEPPGRSTAPVTTLEGGAGDASPSPNATALDRPGPLVPAVAARVAYSPNAANASIYIAHARGYFQDEGLDLSLEPFDAADRIIPAVATGQVEIAAGAVTAGLFNALARGVPITIVAGQAASEPGPPNGPALVIRKDHVEAGRVRDYPDLRGLRIGHPGGAGGAGPVFARLLALGGLEESDVEALELTPPDLATALINGALDVVLVPEPLVTRTVQAGVGVRWKNWGDIYPHQQTTVLLYSPEFPRRQPEAASRFLVAYLRGVRDYVGTMQGDGDRTPVYQILAEYTALKDTDLYATLAPTVFAPDGEVNQESLQADQAFWIARGFIPQPADLASAIDLQYLDAARRQLHGPR